MPGTFSPAADFRGNCKSAIPACITARASPTCRDACRDRLPAVTGKAYLAHAHSQFYVPGKRPMCWSSRPRCRSQGPRPHTPASRACMLHPSPDSKGPSWGPPGADMTQVDPMLAPWTLLCGSLCPIRVLSSLLVLSQNIGYPSETLINSNLVKSRLRITCCSVVISFDYLVKSLEVRVKFRSDVNYI